MPKISQTSGAKIQPRPVKKQSCQARLAPDQEERP
jgi:hypothetical protein